MESVMVIFLAGIGGVFAGMGVLYLAIRLTAAVIDKWFSTNGGEKAEA